MKERALGILAYSGAVAISLGTMFLMATGHGHETLTVDPKAHTITQKNEHSTAGMYYGNVHTLTTVWNLDQGTKTTTDADLTSAGLSVTDTSKSETAAIKPGELAELAQKSPEAAALINVSHLKVN